LRRRLATPLICSYRWRDFEDVERAAQAVEEWSHEDLEGLYRLEVPAG